MQKINKITIYLILLILLVSFVSATNVSINYGWNGTAFIPFRLAGDGRLMTDLNKVNITAGKLVVDTDTLYVDELNNRVGILQTSPNVTFGVSGNTNVSGIFYAGSANITGTVQATTFIGDGSLLSGIDTAFTNNTDINVTNFVANNTFFVSGSMVGIGTKSPGRELEVAGTINATGLNITGTDENATFMGDVRVFGTLYGGSPLKIAGGVNVTGGDVLLATESGNVGIGNTAPTEKLEVEGNFSVGSNMVVNTAGNVGIGTTSPFQKLTLTSASAVGYLGFEVATNAASRRWWIGTDTYAYGDFYIGTEATKQSGPTPDTPRLLIGPTGNVGIGDPTPTEGRLVVDNPDTANLDAVYINHDETGANMYGLVISGAGTYGIYLDTNADDNCHDSTGDGSPCNINDYAEMMEFSELPEDGDVIIIDIENPSELKVSTKPYDKLVAGIASENPAMVIGSYGITIKGWDKGNVTRDDYYTYPLAISGRKRINVNDENGEIMPGDLLVTSSERGKAMKFTLLKFNGDESSQELADKLNQNEQRRNSILGKAMTSKGEDGNVLALITLQ